MNNTAASSAINIQVKYHRFWTNIVASSLLSNFDKGCLIHVNATVLTNHMWTDGRKDDGHRPILTSHLSNHAKQVTSRVFTRFLYSHQRKTAPPSPPGGHVFLTDPGHFELIKDINKTNVFIKFHEHWAKNVTSRMKRHINKTNVLTKFHDNSAPPTGGHVFHRTGTTFKLNQHIIKTNILTNFELDQEMASSVFTRKTAPPTGGHVF
ncbi:hypothetical protein DPMN_164837 [Dreissena polymorpha]|uniref:Uncharacterized protein n=1 Tax=Dreissena polymorpha TaxID=45954 RepID=A0A9D4EVU3_DREPO|nr:hypothetical protein DPMN_164837 [Dreissena polymorpha]